MNFAPWVQRRSSFEETFEEEIEMFCLSQHLVLLMRSGREDFERGVKSRCLFDINNDDDYYFEFEDDIITL